MTCDKSVSVSLNSDSTGSLYTGDIVTGTVTLDFDQDEKIEGIDMEVVGTSKAQWTRSMPTVPYVRIYSEKKKLFFVKMVDIFRGVHNRNRIPAGIHSYPFHFALPSDLPSTFKSSIASVNYCIKIKSKPKNKIKKVVPFNVLGNVNINHLEEMLSPCLYEFEKIFQNTAAKVAVSLKTYKGIAPRQTIPFEITITNEKNIKISKVTVALVQKLRYSISSGYATEEKDISKATYKKLAHSTTEVCNFTMDMPQTAPTSMNVADPLVDISYVYRIEVCFPFHFNFFKYIPVTVATIPVIHYDF